MVRKKKEAIKPVVAKPLNDNHKRNLVTSFVTNNINESVTSNDTDNNTNSVTYNGTKELTENVTKDDTNKVTNTDTRNVTKRVTKVVTTIKTISIGKKDIVAKFTSDKRLRPNYNLSEDTVEKIEKISEILGYKKAEFLDIYLNGTLEKVLRDLEKNLYK